MQPVFRFAPSPNGLLHLGHAFSALMNEACARALEGRLLLRIEDIDPLRSRPEFAAAIEEDLAWLGLRWERPVLRQSDHMAQYADALARLRGRGLLYRCFCSRSATQRYVADAERSGTAWPRDPDGAPHHAGDCAAMAVRASDARATAGDPHVWRLRMGDAVSELGQAPTARHWSPPEPAGHPGGAVEERRTEPLRWGDVVVGRRDVPTSYHLSVVVDDARQGITHVVRGQDLLAATDVHRVLQEVLGLPSPLYHHHRLLLDDEGRKLAKSELSAPLRRLREAGIAPARVRADLGFAAD